MWKIQGVLVIHAPCTLGPTFKGGLRPCPALSPIPLMVDLTGLKMPRTDPCYLDLGKPQRQGKTARAGWNGGLTIKHRSLP